MLSHPPDLCFNRRRIGPADIFSFSLLTIFEVSIVQYNVSVKVVGVVFDHESVRMLLG